MYKRLALLAFSLAVCLFLGSTLLVNDSAAQSGPTWLSFDGSDGPASPELSLLSANPQSIELQASLPGAQAETVWAGGQAFTRLSGEGYGFPTDVGQPELPVLRREVEIPYGAQVSIELVSAQYIDVSLAEFGLHTIYPLQPSQIKLQGTPPAPFALDAAAYTQAGLAPTSPLAAGEAYIVRGHRILPVEVWPVAYDPLAGTLRLYSQLTFRLHLESADMTLTSDQAQRYASPEFDRSLSQRVLNYNQGLALPDVKGAGYLIITADAYYDAMLPFVTLRQSFGFSVTMTRKSQIASGSAQDIKNYIQTAYDTWLNPPAYVLLVGDTDTLPTWTGLETGTATDMYYVTMDGSTDWHADLGYGRFPVRSAAQTTIMVNKYLAYASLTGAEPWLKTISFPATCDNYTVAEGTHNYVINNYTLPDDWIGTFPNNPQPGGDKLYCVTYDAVNQDLIDAFNQGRWAIIYSGHGSYSGWEMGFDPTDVRNLTNDGMFPFVASHACQSGDFAQTEVFGETWVLQENQGALAFWGSSTYSYWDEDDVLERTYFDAFFSGVQPSLDLALMTEAGMAGVEATYPASARYYRETYNILGDPAVKLFLQPEIPTFTLQLSPTSHEVCIAGTVTSTVTIASLMGYAETVDLEHGPLPANVSASFDPASAAAPYTSILSLDVAPGALPGDYTVDITASDSAKITQSAPLALRIVTAPPTGPTLLTPPDASIDQSPQPLFTWEAPPLSSQQHFRLADNPLFENLLIDAPGLTGAAYQPSTPLEGGSCYWWQVSASNACGEGVWSDPFHFATVNMGISFFDGMESGSANWAHQAVLGTDHWIISTAQAYSPTHAWYVPDDGLVTDSRLWNITPVTLAAGSTLTFWHRYEFEGTTWDGAVLEISTNSGGTWSDLGAYITANGYTGTISTSYSNPLGGRLAWTGDLTSWTQVTVDLSSFAGQSVNIRWRLGCDSSVSDIGWYIDDVQISSLLPSLPAPTLLDLAPQAAPSNVTMPVTITGTGFSGTPSLRLGEVWLRDVVAVDENTITATVPAGLAPGDYDLILYNGDCQTATLLDAFTVTEEIPLITTYLPAILK
ncbi:MAG TPA: C25 family cysteine peptidase [Anaerolineales bacterium]|nr:C25 family cysteine peptidase [Anaerolineales bacterium]